MIRNAGISNLNATAVVVCSSSSLVRPRKTGTFAMGFIMAKKPINTITTCSNIFSILSPVLFQLSVFSVVKATQITASLLFAVISIYHLCFLGHYPPSIDIANTQTNPVQMVNPDQSRILLNASGFWNLYWARLFFSGWALLMLGFTARGAAKQLTGAIWQLACTGLMTCLGNVFTWRRRIEYASAT